MKHKLGILFVGKYPPIEGGEASKLYWLARGLGEKGHKVYIVSNCHEVEDPYRCKLSVRDIDELQPKNIRLFSTSPLDGVRFIPYYNPYSEKLTSLALEVCETYDIDVIIGWYLLPYCIAAYNTAKLKRKKLIIQHAGSDISRLLTNQFLFKYLEEIIRNADYIMSYSSMVPLFKRLGKDKIFVHIPKLHPSFNIKGESVNWKKEYGLNLTKNNIFLFLGKLSKRKGLEFLLKAFRKVPKVKYLMIVGNGRESEYFKNKYRQENILFFEPIPPWNIPKLIRSASAVIVPEYNFGIRQHKSRIPLESLLCGTPVIISKQISHKYGELQDFFIEVDPEDTKNFISVLTDENYIEEKRIAIEKNYRMIQKQIGSFDHYVNSVEKFLLEAILH